MKKSIAPKVWRAIRFIILMVLLVLVGWWGHVLWSRGQPPTTIINIAYDNIRRGRDVDYRIFIEENSELVPYLVLATNYGGNVLLLREHIMDEMRPINPSLHGWDRMWAYHDFGAYYPGSDMDNFLNTEFKDTLGWGVIAAMVASDIVVTHKDSIGPTGRDSRVITRYVFLLSRRELGVSDSSIAVPEGQRLRYFRGYHAVRVATLSDGSPFPYWTRTPNTWGTSNVFAIGIDATGSGTADVYSGVRPAFALARSTLITTHTCTNTGATFFVLDVDAY